MQFVRPCAHVAGPGKDAAHAEDHVDIFLGSVRMDHDIALSKRLEIEPYTVSISDLVLSKLQIFRLTEKDVRDLVTLLGDHDVGDEDAPGVVNGRYIGELCAADWGLFYDVAGNLARVDGHAADYALSDEQWRACSAASRASSAPSTARPRAWAGGFALASARARPGTTRSKTRADAVRPAASGCRPARGAASGIRSDTLSLGTLGP